MDFYKRLKDRLVPKTTAVQLDGLETEKEYKERWISIRIVYFTMFLMSLGFSIILTGVWPYLDKLDPTAGKEFMGYIVAANPFAQMIFAPLFGWWGNKLTSLRIPLLASTAIFTIASGLYSSLEIFTDYRKYWMLWSRFLVGLSSANIAVCRSYLSAATKISERTNAVSMVSLAQVLGFVVGPALQAVVVPLGDSGFWLIQNKLKLDMYTAAGWINVLMGILNFCLFLPAIFREHRIAAKEAMHKQGKQSEDETWKSIKPNYLASWTLIIAYFVIVLNFMLLETLGTSLTMDQFAWSKATALYYIGILMSVGAVLACITFICIIPLCKIFAERKVMLWGGFLSMVIGRALYIPWGDTPPIVYDDSLKYTRRTYLACDNYTETLTDSNNASLFNKCFEFLQNNTNVDLGNATKIKSSFDGEEEFLGCPSSQTWCSYTPVMTITQFILGYVVTVIGYPIGVTLIQTIFSKILGPRPQGVWMGLMTGAGCLSRIMGPVFVAYIYTELGTIWTFGSTTVMMVLAMIWLFLVLNKLVPLEEMKVNGTEMQELNKLNDEKQAEMFVEVP